MSKKAFRLLESMDLWDGPLGGGELVNFREAVAQGHAKLPGFDDREVALDYIDSYTAARVAFARDEERARSKRVIIRVTAFSAGLTFLAGGTLYLYGDITRMLGS
ncbi:hypothetical protein IT072_21075 (plasmid) [Leifsonia sp. ZF2019]|uniref:hypothetical protein n=1 Tax=Leifsonia sp. ZF2019 TaxID=2781978 RepID=UPI001CBC18CF|nr:hypothetical protein [Leifsonia sp. ZF2019]UAJ81747.1 hypothetical protein IT072_21075 [Leifsonia sp. ZF2019]